MPQENQVKDLELEQKLRALPAHEQELVEAVMKQHPALTFERALQDLREAGM